MDKIIISKDQEGALVFYKTMCGTLEEFAKYRDKLIDAYKPLASLSVDEMARLLYEPDSYEVDYAFKVGDWVVWNERHICEIESFEEGNRYAVMTDLIGSNGCKQLLSICNMRHATYEEVEAEKEERLLRSYKVGEWVTYHNGAGFGEVTRCIKEISDNTTLIFSECRQISVYKSTLRHATPKEIEIEKERGLWKAIGRNVGEFKNGDIGISKSNNTYRDRPELLTKLYKNGILKAFYPADSVVLLNNSLQ